MQLKSRVMLGVTIMLIIVMSLSSVAIGVLIKRQNRQASYKLLRNSFNTITEFIEERKNKLLSDTFQMATANYMDQKIKYIAENKGSQDYMVLKEIYERIAQTMHKIGLTANMRKVAIYDVDGFLTALAVFNKDIYRLGFIHRSPRPVHRVAHLKPDEKLMPASWQPGDDQGDFDFRLNRKISGGETTKFEYLDGYLCLSAYVPILGHAYDPKTDEMVPKQWGLVKAIWQFDDSFINKMQKLTGTHVNIFTDNGLSAGTLKEYADINLNHSAAEKKPGQRTEDLYFSDIHLDYKDFIQGVLPVYSDGKLLAAIVALHSMQISQRNTWQMIKMLILISIVCILIFLPVAYLFSNSLAKPLNHLIKGIRTISDGDYKSPLPSVPQVEINDIINEFNLMASHIADRTGQLQKEITERTRAEEELKRLNKALEIRIFQQKEAEEALAESEKKYRGIFENALHGIFQSTPDGRFISANPSMAEILGYDSPVDFIESITDIANQLYADQSERKKILSLVQKQDIVSGHETQFYRKDGSIIWVSIHLRAVHNNQGSIALLEGMIEDITQKKALLVEAIHRDRMVSLGELAAGVAHEINNPINGIINYAQILIDKFVHHPKGTEFTERIIKEGDRIERIVTNLLSFAREEKSEKTPVDIRAVITETMEMIDSLLKKDNIKVMQNIPGHLPRVKANSLQIQQVFLNIISNSRDALNQKYPSGGPDKILEINCQVTGDKKREKIRTTFFDHGSGIPANVLNRICDPFFTTKLADKGTGLGLSISHGIIEDHSGKLVFESIHGEYTEAVIDLPVYDGLRR